MRDIVLMSMITVAALMALRRPWVGVLLWVWVSLMNPHRYTYGFALDAPVAAIAAASTLVGLLFSRDRESPFKGAPVAFFASLTIWITVSWLLGLDVSGDYDKWTKVMKINVMVLVALALLRSKEHIFVLTWVMTLSIALLGAKGGLFTVINAGNYRVWGPPGSFIDGNNEFAVAVIMAIPLLRFMQLQATQRWLRWTLMAMMLLCAAAALGSHSRGALLGISAMAVVMWWRGRSRIWGGIFMAVFAVLLLGFMPEEWTKRMDTIETYEEDASALGRFSAWWVSWRLAFEYPTGVGFDITHPELFARFSPYPQFGTPVAHSIFFQMLGHHGFLGLFLFLGVWAASWRAADRIRTQVRDIPQARWCHDMAGMCQVSLVGYLVGGAFLQLGYYDFPYYVMAVLVLTQSWVASRAWERDFAQTSGWRDWIGIGAPSVGQDDSIASPSVTVRQSPLTRP